ncbi:MAG: patatin-like phospholipase family protein [Kiritimatiellales bacterium]|nr:patatin-like phospholipase family protein [Kiritimatiellales bacterium]
MKGDRYRILSLDGGGSKGVYSLGVLFEIEAVCGCPLHEVFNLVYGTSTGSIIAAMLALGTPVEDIKATYFEHIPRIMKKWSKGRRSAALRQTTTQIFGDTTFDSFKTSIGIIATQIDYTKPMIFKNTVQQAHGRAATWQPGFGTSVREAVLASCSAFPFFETTSVTTINQGTPLLMDGGFVGNNPALFALADAVGPLEKQASQIRLLSVGVGEYREPRRNLVYEFLLDRWPFWLARKMLSCNTHTLEIVRQLLFKDIRCVRISDTFAERDYETDLLEADAAKLEKMFQLGRESYAKQEREIISLLKE